MSFGSSSDTDCDLPLTSSSDHFDNEEMDSSEEFVNENSRSVEKEATPKIGDFILAKFENAVHHASSSKAQRFIYYPGCIQAVYNREYEVKFLRRKKGELFGYAKIDDVVHGYPKLKWKLL